MLEVFVPETPLILNLDDVYCYYDTTVELSTTRDGGTFSGPGIIDNTFNPRLAGPGEQFIEYEFGSGACLIRARSTTQVQEILQVQAYASTDTICAGGYVDIYALGSGGVYSQHQYTWLNDVGWGDSLIVRPEQSTTYQVVLSDACSEPDTSEVFLAVKDGFDINFVYGDTVCEGDIGMVIAQIDPPGNYEIVWNSEPPTQGDTLIAPTHFEYEIEVEDMNSGCILEDQAEIASYEFVFASFSPNPNGECLTMEEPDVTFLNQSTGAIRGTWDFGDGTEADFLPFENPLHMYEEIGEYTVKLFIENEAGCWDTTQRTICVLPAKPRIYIPNSFTPNGDNVNDLFLIQGVSILKYELLIYNRWGKLMFQSTDINHSWDGTYEGRQAAAGLYSYYIKLIYKSDNPLINYGPTPWWEQGYLHLIR